MKYDVVVIGGGPAGSTIGAFLKKYDPNMSVLILEREQFPRDHVGESQLPGISAILNEMGCWDKVERAGFPIKLGATYLWGTSQDPWNFDFMELEAIDGFDRPGQYEGPRSRLAFQVDRAIYDQILLDHAQEMGCQVRQQAKVLRVSTDGDRVTGLEVDGLGQVAGTTYIDASGHSGILRRAMGVPVEYPSNLQNVAIWDYWEGATWPDQLPGGATRVQVISVGYGWIWFIPLSATRTSVGLIVPVSHLKESGKPLTVLYEEALTEQPRIAGCLRGAVRQGATSTTKDWSFVAERQSGENWMLVGESSGFADPILAAGMSITHKAAREAAFTILEERRGGDPVWLKARYDERQKRRIKTHIRFADYWYTANAQFSDLKEFTAKLALDNGLVLEPDKAWAWLAQGGFIEEEGGPSAGTFQIFVARKLGGFVGPVDSQFSVAKNNVFKLSLEGTAQEQRAKYSGGRVVPIRCLVRNGLFWPLDDRWLFWYRTLQSVPTVKEIALEIRCHAEKTRVKIGEEAYLLLSYLEALIAEGWVEASFDPEQPLIGAISIENVVYQTPVTA
jgi:flavin-dependent dehydrogenase